MPRRCAVLGSPIAHSLSPVLHRAAYAALGLDWSYDAHRLEAADLAAFIGALGPDWRGMSLTMPLKEAALDVCDTATAVARLTRSVNTILIERSGARTGTNTDVGGLTAAWRAAGVTEVEHAVVVGAGATARSAVVALTELGARAVTVAARSPERAGPLVELIEARGVRAITVPFDGLPDVGAAELALVAVPPGDDAWRPLAATALAARCAIVCDVVYTPRRTAFLVAAERAGRPIVDGFELLLRQAGLQVELMTGCAAAPLDAMRAAGETELARRDAGVDGQP